MFLIIENIIYVAKSLYLVLYCFYVMLKSALAYPALAAIVFILILSSVLGVKKYK